MTPSKAKGTSFESSLVPLLRRHYPLASRAPLAGSNDVGDFHLPTESRFVLEAKTVRRIALAEWHGEAEREARNFARLHDLPYTPAGVVVHKRVGKTDPALQWVSMQLGDFLFIATDHRL